VREEWERERVGRPAEGRKREEGARGMTFLGLRVGHFVPLQTPSGPLAAPLRPRYSVHPSCFFVNLPLSLSLFPLRRSVSPRWKKEKHGYFNENPARLCRHLVSSSAPPPRRRCDAVRLMNAPCKYYFCLCTRQLSAT